MGKTASRVAKNTGFLYVRMGISMLISFYTTRLILLALGAEDYGIYNVVGGAIHMLGFFSAALADPTMRYMSYYKGRNDKEGVRKIYNITMVQNLALALIVIVAFIFSGLWLFNGILNINEERMWAAEIVYTSLVLSTVFTVMTSPYFAVMNAHENMRYYTYVGIFESLLKLVVAYVVVYTSQDKLIVYGVLMTIIPLLSLAIMRVYCHKNYEECTFHPHRYWDGKLSKEILSFASWSFVYSTMSMIGNYGLGIVLNHFYGSVLNAAQGIASQVNSQLMAFSKNLQKAVDPVITKKEGAGARKAMIDITITTSKVSFYMLAFFSIPIFFETSFILSVWLKEVPLWAVLFVQLQIVRNMLVQMTSSFSVAIAAEGRIKFFNIYSGIMWLLPLFFTYLLFKGGSSPVSMYYVTILFMGVFLNIIKVYYMKKNCGMQYRVFFCQVLIPVLIVTIVQSFFTLIPVIILPAGFVRLFLSFILSLTGGFFAVYSFGITKVERKMIQSMSKSVFNKIMRKCNDTNI